VASSYRQGSWLEHPHHVVDASGKESGGGAHRGGRVAVGWQGEAGAAAFREVTREGLWAQHRSRDEKYGVGRGGGSSTGGGAVPF
jgi:hypothetical protein